MLFKEFEKYNGDMAIVNIEKIEFIEPCTDNTTLLTIGSKCVRLKDDYATISTAILIIQEELNLEQNFN